MNSLFIYLVFVHVLLSQMNFLQRNVLLSRMKCPHFVYLVTMFTRNFQPTRIQVRLQPRCHLTSVPCLFIFNVSYCRRSNVKLRKYTTFYLFIFHKLRSKSNFFFTLPDCVSLTASTYYLRNRISKAFDQQEVIIVF